MFYYFSFIVISSEQDAASGKVTSLPQQQWQNLPSSAGFPAPHSKTAAESASWEDLGAAVKVAGKSVLLVFVVICRIVAIWIKL